MKNEMTIKTVMMGCLCVLAFFSIDTQASRRLQEMEKNPLESYIFGSYGQRPSGERFFLACLASGQESLVLVGDYIGKQLGKILQIQHGRFLIREVVEVAPNDWRSRKRWVALLQSREYFDACPATSSGEGL